MAYKYPNTAIIVFCKAPIAGQVKTRLMPELSAEQAANAHIELAHHLLASLSKSKLCIIQLWCSPDTKHPFFLNCIDSYPLSLHQQQGGDLGERMNQAISFALKTYSKVLLVGSDVPSLTTKDFEFALNSLDDTDVVIVPAEDGGYVMIGMTEPHPELFLDMQWGHNNVFNNTQDKVTASHLTLTIANTKWDVDDINDWFKFKSLPSEPE